MNSSKTLSMPEEAFINMLKAFPENVLVNIFWKTLISSDNSPLTKQEKEEIKEAKDDFDKGETIRWENIK